MLTKLTPSTLSKLTPHTIHMLTKLKSLMVTLRSSFGQPKGKQVRKFSSFCTTISSSSWLIWIRASCSSFVTIADLSGGLQSEHNVHSPIQEVLATHRNTTIAMLFFPSSFPPFLSPSLLPPHLPSPLPPSLPSSLPSYSFLPFFLPPSHLPSLLLTVTDEKHSKCNSRCSEGMNADRRAIADKHNRRGYLLHPTNVHLAETERGEKHDGPN